MKTTQDRGSAGRAVVARHGHDIPRLDVAVGQAFTVLVHGRQRSEDLRRNGSAFDRHAMHCARLRARGGRERVCGHVPACPWPAPRVRWAHRRSGCAVPACRHRDTWKYEDLGVRPCGGAVRNKERWKGRRAPTQDPSTEGGRLRGSRTSRYLCWPARATGWSKRGNTLQCCDCARVCRSRCISVRTRAVGNRASHPTCSIRGKCIYCRVSARSWALVS